MDICRDTVVNLIHRYLCNAVLGFDEPKFYQLKGDAYVNSKDIPVKTGGAVGIGHFHAYWCLSKMNLNTTFRFVR